MERRAVILCSGVVQGVGFRPFVYRIAVQRGLTGYVVNLGDAGVKIVVEGEESGINSFLKALLEEKPPLVRYESLKTTWEAFKGDFHSFFIAESSKSELAGGFSNPPPDIATCDPCLRELLNPSDRRYHYPFIVCSHCGPRFTIIDDLPYDRVRTSMVDFPMCPQCSQEYNNPLDRRHHAEPVCCPICGPRMALYDRSGKVIDREEPFKTAVGLIDEGYIVAVKGIGGVHLAVKTTEDAPLAKLRERKRRPYQPFAVMSPSVDAVKKFAEVSSVEEELLTSFRRPIVLLKKGRDYCLSELISPTLDTVGVMLAYSGIHHMLFQYLKDPALVMTSGNDPGQPMAITNDQAFQQLKGLADFFLLHNRRILNRCDDSVVKVVDGEPVPIRRSRGYVPEPIKMPFSKEGLMVAAVGPEKTSTSAVLKESYCYLSQYIGDVDRLESLDYLAQSLRFYSKIFRVECFSAIAHDMHPAFLSTRLAREISESSGAELVSVQHHHAHAVALMVEHGLKQDDELVCITADGVGYGSDGTPWGGEVLLARYADFHRVGHLEPQPMPSGDLCAYRPLRMTASLLSRFLSIDEVESFLASKYLAGFDHGATELKLVLNQLRKAAHPYTTSAGRFLDGISALLGVCFRRSYEGEPAIRLEAVASKGNPYGLQIPIEIDAVKGTWVLRTSSIAEAAFEAFRRGERVCDIAASVQRALAEGLAELAVLAAEKFGVKWVGFSGGVAYNNAMVSFARRRVKALGFKFIRHKFVPCGDGGVSLGQAAVAAVRKISKQ